jgi:DNA-binding IclR family transcriptional regulator
MAEREPKGIQSIEIGMNLFREIVEARRPMRLRDVANASGLTPSKARMYLVSLVRTGMIEQDSANGHYVAGPAATRLGILAFGDDRILDAGRRALATLGDSTGDPVLLSAWNGDRSVIVATNEYARNLPMSFRVGSATPVDTATGRVFLAFLPEAVSARIIASDRFDRPVTPAELAQIRSDGFARAGKIQLGSGVTLSGMGAIAAPIFGRGNRVEFVLSALHAVALGPEEIAKRVQQLRTCALNASQSAGDAFPV